jgi:hypothetical protein
MNSLLSIYLVYQFTVPTFAEITGRAMKIQSTSTSTVPPIVNRQSTLLLLPPSLAPVLYKYDVLYVGSRKPDSVLCVLSSQITPIVIRPVRADLRWSVDYNTLLS